MSDKISISFKNKNEKSVALFNHLGGIEFAREGLNYLKRLKEKLKKRKSNIINPLTRLEPGIVMVDFIRDYTKNMEIVESSLWLGKDENDGDNSDNGHFVIDINKEEIIKNGN